MKSPHGLWLFVLCQALSVSVKNAFPALHGVLCVFCWRFCKSYQGWEALRGHSALDCIIWVQPSSFAALMFDKCIALYHQTLLWFCVKIFHFCSPLSLIDNALRAFYLLQRLWLTRFILASSGEKKVFYVTFMKSRWYFCQRCFCLLYKQDKTV